MGHYIANVRDIQFNLFEVLDLGAVLGIGGYSDLNKNTIDLSREAARLAEGPIAESFASADRNPPVFDPTTHSISVAPVGQTVEAIKEAGWWRRAWPKSSDHAHTAPADIRRHRNALLRQFLRLHVLPGHLHGPGAVCRGTEEQGVGGRGCERGWAATMVLTEPDAGSDVGAARAKAIQQPDGTWHIEGVKRFISGGDVGDTAENVYHLVLARPEGAGPGTKGLSLFYVPNYLFDPETLNLVPATGFSPPGWNTRWVSSPLRRAN